MKYTLITILVVFTSFSVSGQLHSLYADAGSLPGFSLTYNYKFSKHWGGGLGFQGNYWNPPYDHTARFIPGLYGDIRLHSRPGKKNQFFTFLDLGIDFYKRDKRVYDYQGTVVYSYTNNGLYTGLGFAYLRRMTQRGGGLYVSLRLAFDFSKINTYSLVSEKSDGWSTIGGGDLVLSVGFKF